MYPKDLCAVSGKRPQSFVRSSFRYDGPSYVFFEVVMGKAKHTSTEKEAVEIDPNSPFHPAVIGANDPFFGEAVRILKLYREVNAETLKNVLRVPYYRAQAMLGALESTSFAFISGHGFVAVADSNAGAFQEHTTILDECQPQSRKPAAMAS